MRLLRFPEEGRFASYNHQQNTVAIGTVVNNQQIDEVGFRFPVSGTQRQARYCVVVSLADVMLILEKMANKSDKEVSNAAANMIEAFWQLDPEQEPDMEDIRRELGLVP